MKNVPIELSANHLSSIIVAMLLQQGKTEFTLPITEYENLELNNHGVACTGVWEEGNHAYPVSITVTVMTLAEIAELIR